jgi:hypothetical protein
VSLTPPTVTVVIPNWNGREHLPGCLAALAAQTLGDFEVVLVDNASSDDGVAWVREHHPEVTVVERPDNGGFAVAVNEGIRRAAGRYVALLNNDTAAAPGWLAALRDALDAHPGYDVAASLMVLHEAPRTVNAAGDVYDLPRLAGRNRGFGRPASRYAQPRRVLGACAGAALYRRSLFAEVGLFDEDFFLMSEDTDFNLRCLLAGKKCLYVPGAVIRHKYRASIDTVSVSRMDRLAMRNEAMVVTKDLPRELLAVVPLLWPWRFVRHTFPVRPSKWRRIPQLVRQSPDRLRAEAEGLRLGWRKRRSCPPRRVARRRDVLRWLLKGSGPV